MKKQTDLIIINNVKVPAPDEGYTIIESTNVDAGRNTNGAVIGQKVGRNIWKINNLQWSNLTPQEWASLKQALEPFYVNVTFTDDLNVRHTIKMYPGDRQSQPYNVSGLGYKRFRDCKFNLIDCGW